MEKNQQIKNKNLWEQSIINIDVIREGNKLKTSINEQISGDLSSIQHYDEIFVPFDRIEKRCKEIVDTLNHTNRKGKISKNVFLKLKEVGQVFYDELFSINTKEKLRSTNASFLRLNIDDQLVQIPWELLYDGEDFLCQRFNMGRSVRTKQAVPITKKRDLTQPLSMLLLADPRGDLNGAYKEGIELRNFMDQYCKNINVSSQFDNISIDSIKEKIRNFDIVHFAGHADYNMDNPQISGWRLSNCSFVASDIKKMAGARPMPALVFSNACQSARTDTWALQEHFHNEIFGLANAFLLSGVKHYIGTFCEILDEPSSHFSLKFYERLRTGKSIGEAIRLARKDLIKKYGEETILWASYILYGDPTFCYNEPGIDDEIETPSKPFTISNKIRTSSKEDESEEEEEEVILFDPREHAKKKIGSIMIIGAVFLLFFSIMSGIIWLGKTAQPPQIQMITSDDQAHKRIIEEIREKMSLVRDQEKRKQIEKNIKELEKKIPRGTAVVNNTKSDIITMMLDFRSTNHNSGKNQLISSIITEQLLQYSKIQVVERNDLDKVLDELNFGTSKLIDPSRRLSLGKILSAKLILSGWIEDSEDKYQVSMRISEIETGRTLIVSNVLLTNTIPIIVQKGLLSSQLIEKLKEISL